MESLSTTTAHTNFLAPPYVSQNSSSSFKLEIPQSSVMIPKPLSYEFRVVEHVKDGQIMKVGLQYQVWEHDPYGVGIVKHQWKDVERVQKDVDTGAIL